VAVSAVLAALLSSVFRLFYALVPDFLLRLLTGTMLAISNTGFL